MKIKKGVALRGFLIVACLLLLSTLFLGGTTTRQAPKVEYSDLVTLIQADRIASIQYSQSDGMVLAKVADVPVPEDQASSAGSAEVAPAQPASALPEKDRSVKPVVEKASLPSPVVDPGVDAASLPYSATQLSRAEDAVKGLAVFSSQVPVGSPGFVDLAVKHGVSVTVAPLPKRGLLRELLPTIFFVVFFGAVLFFIHRRSSAGGGNPLASHAKSRVKLMDPSQNKVRLSDVAGCDEAKQEVAELVNFLKNRDNYERVGAVSPKGVLMYGPPGTGKTLLARAIAGEAGVPFFTASGSSFVEMFVGVGAARVRDAFEQAKANAPCILFIDEIDAVGKARSEGARAGGGSDEHDQTLNEVLTQMDGFESNSGVIVIGATNRPEVLDKALRRPGRFDREVVIPLPDRKGREQILAEHGKKYPVDNSVSWEKIARGTSGFSGADLANLLNEAALFAGRHGDRMVTSSHVDQARDKILMGVARSGTVMNEKERTTVAYHEAGHAVVAHCIPGTDPVHKITILPRGRALGVTMQVPSEDIYNQDEDDLRAEIAILCGGRAAEQVVLNRKTVGATNDFDRATRLARRMVGMLSMSEAGVVSVHGERGEEYSQRVMSEKWLQKVDDETHAIVDQEYQRALSILRDNRDALERVAQALLVSETLDEDQFVALMENREDPAGVADPGVPSAPAPSDRVQAGVDLPRQGRSDQGQLAL